MKRYLSKHVVIAGLVLTKEAKLTGTTCSYITCYIEREYPALSDSHLASYIVYQFSIVNDMSCELKA